MSMKRVLSRRCLAAAAVTATAVATSLLYSASAGASSNAVALPPAHAGFDYQIGGEYDPPSGVTVVSRDHEAPPAQGLYNICYVNAFQTQPGELDDWDSDLLLKDADGNNVVDGEWDEVLLDISTEAKRVRIAEKVNGWIDGCASKGFQAVEPDNYDTYTRSDDLLDDAQAQAMVRLLSSHAHGKGLAVAQKNTAELAGNAAENGLDFAVAEECGQWEECGTYQEAFGNEVIVIEYTSAGLKTACDGWGDELSIVRRDKLVRPDTSSGYLRETC
ncbi:endo alpha-1,4 polygalactosaminidase [Streptomyces sp. NBC_01012]|uniref:endo alpha-1,4 polygalactosaminidase n=1 Tax=Streptomyces sp. NBC_01012 TaxID=2903717 RepID=UPI00386A0883|nr:endo alpha-1,4 polygalactosaminidase [Streptomyces sp. NBC_01012]